MSAKDRRLYANPLRIPEGTSGFRLEPQRYIIGWPDGVVKIGLTWNGKRRWGIFIGKGGDLLDLATYSSKNDALEAEQWLHGEVSGAYPPAFSTKDQSSLHIGKAGGWMECYRIPVQQWPSLLQIART